MTTFNAISLTEFARFTHGITTWPCLNELGPESCASTMCGACEKGKAATMLQMFGQPYNSNTLATLPPKPEAMLNRVSTSDSTFYHHKPFPCRTSLSARTVAPCVVSTTDCTT